MDHNLAREWGRHVTDFESAPLTLEHVQIAFYLGALAYSDLLRQGVTVRQEAEDFLVANPLVSQP